MNNEILKLVSNDVLNQEINLCHNHFVHIQNFQLSKLQILQKQCDENIAFYPLSGIDFPHLYYFYPNAKKYIMVGMEKLGKIPDNIEDYFVYKNDIVKLLQEYNITQYFSRIGMRIVGKSDSEDSRLGLLLIIFAIKMGLIIDDIKYVKEGEYEGIVIKFHKNGENTVRELIYLTMELKGKFDMFQQNFFDKYEKINMFLKASEYSLQLNKFSETVDYLLNKTDVVIQDDSGISYSKFDDDSWEKKLYGNYVGRVIIPHTAIVYDQTQLLKDYNTKTIEELPFEFGYPHGFGAIIRHRNPGATTFCGSDITSKPSNLMVLVKKQ